MIKTKEGARMAIGRMGVVKVFSAVLVNFLWYYDDPTGNISADDEPSYYYIAAFRSVEHSVETIFYIRRYLISQVFMMRPALPYKKWAL